MHCAHCGRRIKRAAAESKAGPVGPVCAVTLGLLPVFKSAKSRPARLTVRLVAPVVDEAQMALEFA